MMERHDHTNPWADKLQEVTIPDAHDSWNAMAVLLDKEMPLPVRSNRRRWLLLVLLLLLLIGVCNCPRVNRWHSERVSSHQPAPHPTPHLPGPNASVSPDPGLYNPSTAGGSSATPFGLRPGHPPGSSARFPVPAIFSGKDSLSGSGTLRSSARSSATDPDKQRADASRSNAGTHPHKNSSSGTGGSNTAGSGTLAPGTTASGAVTAGSPSSKTTGTHRLTNTRPHATGTDISETTASGTTSFKSATSRKGARSKRGAPRAGRIADTVSNQPDSGLAVTRKGSIGNKPGSSSSPGSDLSVVAGKNGKDAIAAGIKTTGKDSAGVSAKTTSKDSAVAAARKTGKDSAVANSKKTGENNHPVKKPVVPPDNKKTPPADTTREDRVRGLVAGIGLNQFFTVGQQQKSAYNSGGTSGGLGDYLPVPMIRYYFSKKLYVQLEAQFNTPQYTKNNLVASQSPADTLSPGRIQQSSVTIKKLFYFNLPLSVHYSPIKNLYLGTGLQYSRLSNGVGLFQDKVLIAGGNDSVKVSKIQSFRGDTTYQKIRTNEFRFLLDINYTYKRFIVGARYNQALSKFLDVHISSTQVTQARNSSLQLYLRYILWDNRKRKPVSSK